ncbi:hypothetical protein GCM10027399_20410 [Curvibacter fontanus]|jgi:hypothetical protein
MDPHFSDATASSFRLAGAAALRRELQQEAEEDRLSVKGRARVWPMVVAFLALVAVLPVFLPCCARVHAAKRVAA